MRFEDYLNQCLKNPEFKKYWEEDNELVIESSLPAFDIDEALKAINALDEEDLSDIIKNKGVKATVPTQTEIIFYENDGKCPVKAFLEDIKNERLKSKTLKNIASLSVLGKNARPPLSSYVEDGIFELRTEQGGWTRIFSFFIFGNEIVMTNGYIKKQNKLDKTELAKAKRYRDEYLKR